MKKFKTPLMQRLQRANTIAQLAAQPSTPANCIGTDSITEYLDPAFQASKAAQSRRQFLKNTSQLTLGLGVWAMTPDFHLPFDTRPKARIAIVGGGIAGLNAAYRLKQNGIKATLYEADKRIGGRMLTKELFGNTQTTELGGEFLDSDHTEMLRLAKLFEIPIFNKKRDKLIFDAFYFNGKHYTEKDVVEQFNRIRWKVAGDNFSLGPNLDTPQALAFDRLPMSAYFQQLEVETWFKDLLKVAYEGEYGLDYDEQSAINFIAFVGDQSKSEKFDLFGESDEIFKLKGGNQQICTRLAEQLRGGIRLEHRLVAVKSKGKGFTLTFDDTAAGKTIDVDADVVIMTLPFSILRTINFNVDNLPPQKKKCIDTLSYGTNTKLFMDINSRIWRSNGYQGYLYSERIPTGWDSYHFQNKNQGKSVYTILFGGREAQAMKKENETYKPYLGILDKAFEGMQQHFTGAWDVANWATNPFSKGSYICYTLGQQTDFGGWEGKRVGNMLFAGEHCSSEWAGFMNGAAVTGRQAAAAILKMV